MAQAAHTYTTIGKVKGLDDTKVVTVNALLKELADRQRRNALRDSYYDSKRLIRSVAQVVPPLYNQLGLVVGWTQKAVDLLARRCTLERFVWPDGDIDSLGARNVWVANALRSEIPQALTSSLIHSVSFAVPSVREGGGAAYLHFHDARSMTALRDGRTRSLTSALSVDDADDDGTPTELSLYETGLTTVLVRDRGTWSVKTAVSHAYGLPVFPLPYRPRLRRPFGSSRITRPMMSIQDQAIRELVRLEGHMDIFSFPELWMLGADLSIFDEEAWKVRMGRLKGVPDDDTAENPRVSLHEVSSASPEPHLAALNAFAKLFAREANLPDSSLAITDLANPTSADSYDASQYDLIADAEGATDDWDDNLAQAFRTALAMSNSERGVPEAYASIGAKWRNPRFLSRAAEADAGLKQIMAVPSLADTDVGLELLGLSEQQIDRVLGERRRTRAAQMLDNLTGEDSGLSVKDKADALGVLIRAGADPAQAAVAVGLQGMSFTGAVPTSLRLPESDASQLEDV